MGSINQNVRQALLEQKIFLWICANSTKKDIRTAVDLPWSAIWSETDPAILKSIFDTNTHLRKPMFIERPEGRSR